MDSASEVVESASDFVSSASGMMGKIGERKYLWIGLAAGLLVALVLA